MHLQKGSLITCPGLSLNQTCSSHQKQGQQQSLTVSFLPAVSRHPSLYPGHLRASWFTRLSLSRQPPKYWKCPILSTTAGNFPVMTSAALLLRRLTLARPLLGVRRPPPATQKLLRLSFQPASETTQHTLWSCLMRVAVQTYCRVEGLDYSGLISGNDLQQSAHGVQIRRN